MILMVLSILDIIAGVLLAFSIQGSLISLLGIVILIKGISSVIGSLANKNLFDWMGWIDVVAGTVLYFGFIVPWLWMVVILKGLYSFVFSLQK